MNTQDHYLKRALLGFSYLFVISTVYGQEGDRERQPRVANPGRPTRERIVPRIDSEAMHERRLAGLRIEFGVSDAEWQAIEPKLARVMSLTLALAPSANLINRSISFRRGVTQRTFGANPIGANEGNPNREIGNAFDDLLETYKSPESSDEDIRGKLRDYLQVRAQVRKELAREQAALRELLSVRQEARLVMEGYLDLYSTTE